MAYPTDSDFQLPDGTLVRESQYTYNFQRIPVFWSSGSYDINVNSITAGTYNGLPTDSFTATTGESIAAGDVVRWEGGLIYKATNATEAGITNIAGVSSTTTASGQTATIETDFYNSYSSLTIGVPYYVGVDGAITTTNPQVRAFIIGNSVTATRLNLTLRPKLESKELINTNFISKTLDVTVGSSFKYKIIDFTSGNNFTTGMFHAVATGATTFINCVYSIATNSAIPQSSVTEISSNTGLIFGIEDNNKIYVQASAGGTFNLKVMYTLQGEFSKSQLLDTAVTI
jgi:hypothetical protein